MEAREFGLMDKFISDAFSIPNAEKCFAKNENSAKDVPIKLVDLTGAFLILGIGLGLGILCFLIELIIGKYRREMELMRGNAGNQIGRKNRTRCPPIENKPIAAEAVEKDGPTVINEVTAVVNQLPIEVVEKEGTGQLKNGNQVIAVVEVYNRSSTANEEGMKEIKNRKADEEELEVIELE